jgi:hypothetical protein
MSDFQRATDLWCREGTKGRLEAIEVDIKIEVGVGREKRRKKRGPGAETGFIMAKNGGCSQCN